MSEDIKTKKVKKSAKSAKKYSILKGRSMCPACEHPLRAGDLVPLFSWLWLKGACRYCGHKISWQYPLTELVTAGLFALSYIFWPYGWESLGLTLFIFWLVFLVGFVALAVYDLRWMELPDVIVWPLVGLALAQLAVIAIWQQDAKTAAIALVSGLGFFAVFWLMYQVSKGNWIGGGDVKLALVLGMLAATPLRSVLVLFVASLVGTVVSVPALLARKSKVGGAHVPFGPALLLGLVIIYLFGARLIDAYTSLLIG